MPPPKRRASQRRRSEERKRIENLTPAELEFLASLFDAARDGRTAELAEAIRAAVPVNLTNDGGDTLLILAAYHVHAETVSTLLELGADTERVNDRGQTALGAGVFRQCAPIVSALLAAGADPHGGSRTAVELATYFRLPDMLALLHTPPGTHQDRDCGFAEMDGFT